MDKTRENSPPAPPSSRGRAPAGPQRLRLLVLLMLMLAVVVLAGGAFHMCKSLYSGPARRGPVRPEDIQPTGPAAPADALANVGELTEVNEDELELMPDGRFKGPLRTTQAGPPEPGLAPDRPGSPDMAEQALAAAGMALIQGDVPDAVVPPDAKRLYAYRRSIPGGESVVTCAYLIPMGLASAEKFYEARLAEKGYNLAARRAGSRPADRIMTFAKDRNHCYYVNLHPTDKDTEVKAVLMIVRLGPPQGGT